LQKVITHNLVVFIRKETPNITIYTNYNLSSATKTHKSNICQTRLNILMNSLSMNLRHAKNVITIPHETDKENECIAKKNTKLTVDILQNSAAPTNHTAISKGINSSSTPCGAKNGTSLIKHKVSLTLITFFIKCKNNKIVGKICEKFIVLISYF